MTRHLLDDVLGKRAGLSRGADEGCRLQILDHLSQRDVIAVGDLPSGYALLRLRKRPADLFDVVAARVDQPSDVNQPELLFRLFLGTTFADPLADYRCDDLIGDPGRGRSRAEHHYSLVAQPFAVDFDRRE